MTDMLSKMLITLLLSVKYFFEAVLTKVFSLIAVSSYKSISYTPPPDSYLSIVASVAPL